MNIYHYVNEKGKRKWRYDKKVQGQRIREQGFGTRKGCQKALSTRIEALEKIDTDFLRLCETYLDYSETRYTHKTYLGKRRAIRGLLVSHGHSMYPTSLDVLRFLEKRAKETSSDAYNRARKELHAMFEWGIKHNLVRQNPVRQLERLGIEPSVKYIPPVRDISKVLLVAGDYRDLLECVLYTLGRKSEILKLRWEDIDLENQTIRLWTRKRKDGSMESDILPMPSPLYAILSRRSTGHTDHERSFVFINPRSKVRFTQLSELMQRLCRKAGVKPFTFHALRHYGASYLHRKGEDLKTIQLWHGCVTGT